MTKGFTLIETLLYIALSGTLIGVLVISAFVFIQENVVLGRKAEHAQAELLQNFNDYRE